MNSTTSTKFNYPDNGKKSFNSLKRDFLKNNHMGNAVFKGRKESGMSFDLFMKTTDEFCILNNHGGLVRGISIGGYPCLSDAQRANTVRLADKINEPPAENASSEQLTAYYQAVSMSASAATLVAKDNDNIQRRNAAASVVLKNYVLLAIDPSAILGITNKWQDNSHLGNYFMQFTEVMELMEKGNKDIGAKHEEINSWINELPSATNPNAAIHLLGLTMEIKQYMIEHLLFKEEDGTYETIDPNFPASTDPYLLSKVEKLISLDQSVQILRTIVHNAIKNDNSLVNVHRKFNNFLADYQPPTASAKSIAIHHADVVEPTQQSSAMEQMHQQMQQQIEQLQDMQQMQSDQQMQQQQWQDQQDQWEHDQLVTTQPQPTMVQALVSSIGGKRTGNHYGPNQGDKRVTLHSSTSTAPRIPPLMYQNSSAAVPPQQSMQVCPHYLRNACSFGDRCRFSHDQAASPQPGADMNVKMSAHEYQQYQHHLLRQQQQMQQSATNNQLGATAGYQPSGAYKATGSGGRST